MENLLRRLPLLVAVLGLLLFLAVPPFLPRWTLFLLTLAWAKAMAVVGIVLLLRGGLVTFGHALFYAVGAYAAGFASKGLGVRDALALVALGVVAGAGMAALLGAFLARYREVYFALLNLAFSMVLYALLLKFYWVTGGTDGMRFPSPTLAGVTPSPPFLRLAHYYFTLGLGVLGLYGAYRFITSPLGYTLRAVRDNEVRVEYMGGSVWRAVYSAYIFAGALGALGGVLAGMAVGHLVPELAYWTQSGEFVFVALLGGTGSMLAPVAGSIVFEFVRNYAFKFSPYTWQMTLGFVLLFIILFLPGGLWSLSEPVARRWAKWALSWRQGP